MAKRWISKPKQPTLFGTIIATYINWDCLIKNFPDEKQQKPHDSRNYLIVLFFIELVCVLYSLQHKF